MTLEIARPWSGEGGQASTAQEAWRHEEMTGLFMRAGEGGRGERLGNTARALVDLMVHPSHWELRREFVPVHGNPHGNHEEQSRLVLRHRRWRMWDG